MGAGPHSPYLMPARAGACICLGSPIGSPPQRPDSVDESSLPGVPDTDENTTDTLWHQVYAAMSSRGTSAKSGRRQGGRAGKTDSDVGKISPSVSAPQSLFDPSQSQVTPESTVANTARTISPRSSKFTKLILHPRGITVDDTNSIVPSAFSHFGTEEPMGGTMIEYRRIAGLSSANIWVTMDDNAVKTIAAEYREMRGLGFCEEEFATFAKENFLRGELRSQSISEDRQWRADRTLQLVCPPKESAHWRTPPLLDCSGATETEWAWDVRPDCAYWLSLKGFNPRYRFQIQNCAFVRDWITCPYFTVEFKRDGESEDVAVKQVVSAGALALFNRYSLHAKAREARPGLEERQNVRHYTLTFVGHKFVFWVIEPILKDGGGWAGCVMKRLFGADCTDEYAVRELAHWINEIHRYGLSQHGPSCERDIKAVLNIGGVRTSDVQGLVSQGGMPS